VAIENQKAANPKVVADKPDGVEKQKKKNSTIITIDFVIYSKPQFIARKEDRDY
jgi:hypothetical protein